MGRMAEMEAEERDQREYEHSEQQAHQWEVEEAFKLNFNTIELVKKLSGVDSEYGLDVIARELGIKDFYQYLKGDKK